MTIVAHDVEGAGGMERQLRALITGLLERGASVTVVSRTLGLPAHERLRWRRVPGPGRPFVLAYPWFALAASLILMRSRDGVVHTTGAIVLNRADVCTVHYLHRGPGGDVDRARRQTPLYRLNASAGKVMSRLLERLVYSSPSRSARLVAVSELLRREIIRAFPERADDVRLIGNGVDLNRFQPDPVARKTTRDELGLSNRDFMALFVGSEWRGKGLDVAIDALGSCAACHLVVVGEGDADEALRRAESLGVTERLRLVGETDQPERYYAAADVFVLPSAYESFSIAAFEAAASGLPVVATAVGAIPDLVAGGGGILVERRAEGVAAALRKLAADASTRSSMGIEGRRIAVEFGWDAVVDAYYSLYAPTANPSALQEVARR